MPLIQLNVQHLSVNFKVIHKIWCQICQNMKRLRYRYGIRLAIYRSWVRVLARHHCVVAFAKLLTPVCLCHQAVQIGTSQWGVISLAGKVTAGLEESNSSLPLGLWLMSPADWLPRNQDQLRAQLVIKYGTTLPFLHKIDRQVIRLVWLVRKSVNQLMVQFLIP